MSAAAGGHVRHDSQKNEDCVGDREPSRQVMAQETADEGGGCKDVEEAEDIFLNGVGGLGHDENKEGCASASVHGVKTRCAVRIIVDRVVTSDLVIGLAPANAWPPLLIDSTFITLQGVAALA